MSELDNWIKIINLDAKTGLRSFYESGLRRSVSNIPQFEWAIDSYGTWPIIEAILAASKKKFIDDPLPYVMAVAQAKWKESVEALSEAERYERGVERSKHRINRQNEELEIKLAKAREKKQSE